MPDQNDPLAKKTGIDHLLAATGYSLHGFLRALKEAAFRHELVLAAVILIAMAWAGCGRGDTVMAVILLLALLGVEALNTAIEEVIDRISPEVSDTGRHAKDLGSFAVFCLIAANILFAGNAIAVQCKLF